MALAQALEEDFREEIQANVVLETDRLIAEGMSPEDAKERPFAHSET